MADMQEEQLGREELLLQTQRKEKKALQAEIQRLKHSIPKGDKKKKKSVTEEIAKLETDLAEKHQRELADLKEDEEISEVENRITERVETLTVDNEDETSVGTSQTKKMSKAEKRRNKKAAQASEREARIREQEVHNLTSSRHLEAVKIKSLLRQRGLQIHEIPSDGNCLYAALAHQLTDRDLQVSVERLRQQTAEYMRANMNNFIPFLSKDNGDPYTPDDFEAYCREIEDTAAWGGQLEIQALASALQVPIEVIQSEGPAITIGENYKCKSIILTYYRHAYGLGEHYHSVEKLVDEKDEDFR